MQRKQWDIESLLLNVGAGSQQVSRAIVEILAEELGEAISNNTLARVSALKDALGLVISDRFSRLSREQRSAILQSDDQSDASVSFALGQLEFAQLLASQVVQRQPNEEFVLTLKDRRFVNYVRNLARADLTNVELAAALEVEDETVSRNLKKLRMLGITDFRKEGKHVINFLTPAARRFYREEHQYLAIDFKEPIQMLAALKNDIPLFLHHTLTLSPEVDSDCAIGG